MCANYLWGPHHLLDTIVTTKYKMMTCGCTCHHWSNWVRVTENYGVHHFFGITTLWLNINFSCCWLVLWNVITMDMYQSYNFCQQFLICLSVTCSGTRNTPDFDHWCQELHFSKNRVANCQSSFLCIYVWRIDCFQILKPHLQGSK